MAIPATFETHLMAKIESAKTYKRLRNRYRLVIMNDDTFEEVVRFRLSRLSVYVVLSAVFVLLVGLTIFIVSFTNLRYMIPGYGKQSSIKDLRMLKMRTDSLELVVGHQRQYLEDVQRVLRGDTASLRKDTSMLELPPIDSVSTD
jgi:hypothetical protein